MKGKRIDFFLFQERAVDGDAGMSYSTKSVNYFKIAQGFLNNSFKM